VGLQVKINSKIKAKKNYYRNIVKAFFTSVTLFDVLSVFQGLVEVEHQYK